MKTSFLDYYKLILEKVSFDPQLFNKEYQKAINTLHSHEARQLDQWLKNKGLSPGIPLSKPMYQKTSTAMRVSV